MTTPQPSPSGDDLLLEINARGGIPLSLAGYLLRAVGAAYPNTSIKPGTSGYGPVLQLLIPRDDLHEAEADDVDVDVVALGSEKDVAELAAVAHGRGGGALHLAPPPWLSTLLQHAAEQMVDAMPPAAENYVAIEINRPGQAPGEDLDSFTWIVCRPGRPSPHQLRREAEEERDRLRAQLDELLPYAAAGADALDHREPYGLADVPGDPEDPSWEDHDAFCDAAGGVLERIRSGEFGPSTGGGDVPAGAPE